MADQTQWQPDPYGVHEFRFFSADGKPTLLVMDGGKTSYDRPPPATPHRPAPEPPSSPEPEAPRARDLPLAPPPAGAGTVQALTPPTAHVTHTSDADPNESVAPLNRPAVAMTGPTTVDSDSSKHGDAGDQETLSRSLKVVYGVVLGALTLSVLGLAYVHFHHSAGRHLTHADGTTTTTSASRTTTTTAALPTALQPSAEGAATALVSNWSTGNRSAALTVATPVAVATLFAVPYASGQALDRGCSTSFSPIVCTFGPPGGASPTDPIYEIDVTQTSGGWYVSSVKTEN